MNDTERLRYDLTYTSDALDSRSDLTSVTVTGGTGPTTTSQELGFTYYPPNSETAGPRGNLLQEVSLPSGGVIHYDYQPSTQLRDNEGLLNHRPPVPLLVVTALTRADFTGRQDTTQYQYRDGHLYFDTEVGGQVAGFGRVAETDPLEQRTEYFFHQGGGFDGASLGETLDDWFLMGRPYRTERYDTAGTLRQRQITRWASTPLGDGRSFIRPVDEVTTRFGTAGPDRSSATSRTYDPATGNVLEVVQYGEVAANDDGTFVDVGNDSRRSATSYAQNTEKHILALPASELLHDHAGTLVARTDYRYDDLPVGEVDRGARTHEIAHLLEESREIVTRRTYNLAGQLTGLVDPRSHAWTITYDALGVHPSTVRNPLGHVTQYEIDPLTGRALTETDPNGLITRYTYDGLGRKRLIEQSHPQFGETLQPVEQVTYDDQSRPSSIVTETFLAPMTTSRQVAYLDGFGRTLQTRRQTSGDQRYSVSNSRHDAIGRVTEEQLAVFGDGVDYDPADTSPYKTATRYDLFGRAIQVGDFNGITITEFDAWTETVLDPNDHQKTYDHDAFDRLKEVVEQVGDIEYATHYEYDARDQLTTITNAAGHVRRFSYDSLGRLIRAEDLHDPDDPNFGVVEYSYDDADNRVLELDAAGRQTVTTYDPLNRPVEKTSTGPASGTQLVTFTYDEGEFGKGQLTSTTTDQGSWQASYDLRGQLTRETANVEGTEYAKDYTYTYFGEVGLATYPNDMFVQNLFNEVGELEGVNINGQVAVAGLEYNAASQLERIEYGNGAISELVHDPAQMHRLTAKQTEVAGSLLQDLTYQYDPIGNMEVLADAAPTAVGRSASYQYDELNRLTQADVTAPSESYQRTYNYDATGNIISSFLGQYQYAAPNEVNSQAVTRINHAGGGHTTFAYDPSGRLASYFETSAGQSTDQDHRWDNRALLVESDVVDHVGNVEWRSTNTYTYDHADRRTQKRVVTQRCAFGYDSSHSIQCDPDVVTWKRYPFVDLEVEDNEKVRLHLFADDLHVATVERDVCPGSDHSNCPLQVYFHHDDHLGGANLVTDQSGAVVQLLDYYPFGSARVDERTAAYDSTQDFTGHELDDDTGLHYAKARYYGSQYGRFISPDPLQWRPAELFERFGRNPQGLNFYSYALNNPLVLTDPTGEFACGGGCLALLLGVASVYFSTDAQTALAPDPTMNRAVAPTQSPSLFEGVVQGIERQLDDRQLGGAADAVKVGAAVVSGYNAARTLKPSRLLQEAEDAAKLVRNRWDDVGEATSPLKITKYSQHGLDRALGDRGDGGVNPRAILDALRNPSQAFRQADGLYKFKSNDACIIFDRCGKIITTWPLNNRARRIPY